MGRSNSGQCQIEGTVAQGFESVRQLYEHNMRTLVERNTQLCVYHRGKRVVDLWATATGDSEFSPDTLVNVFSSGKSLEAIAMASLVGKGLLDYDARITDYWPEFGANGKGEVTVADLMRHEAGLAALRTPLPPEDLLPASIKQNRVGAVIEGHTQRFRAGGGSRREYHAISRGWIANEVFRRVDPAGRTIGEFIAEDISGPLGADVAIGLEEADLDRVSRVSPLRLGFQLREGLKPKALGRRTELNTFQIFRLIGGMIAGRGKTTTADAPPPFKGLKGFGSFNRPEVVMGETPSANAHCSARGLAKIGAMMSAGGKSDGTQYLSEQAWRAMHGEPVEADMGFINTTFTQGGVNSFTATTAASSDMETAFNAGREGFFGWMGLGGSILQWHPQHEIGFGYVPTSLNVMDFLNTRGKAYQQETLRCIDGMNS